MHRTLDEDQRPVGGGACGIRRLGHLMRHKVIRRTVHKQHGLCPALHRADGGRLAEAEVRPAARHMLDKV